MSGSLAQQSPRHQERSLGESHAYTVLLAGNSARVLRQAAVLLAEYTLALRSENNCSEAEQAEVR